MSQRCKECGAVYDDGADCESCFHALLAFENERPAAFGAVHHLTVATYYLQHPAGYTHAALAHWREIVRKALTGVPIRELRELSGRRFGGAKRVRDPGSTAPPWWPAAWPLSVRDVFAPGAELDVDTYLRRAREWGRTTLAALDAAQPA